MGAPRLSVWLLNRFGVEEAVVGDLVEQLDVRRSRLWFWRQAVGAIFARLIEDIRIHPFVAARAVVIGLLLRQANSLLWRSIGPSVDMWIGQWVISLFNPNHPTLIVLVLLANAAMASPMWFGIGWFLGYSHRARLVLLFVCTTWTIELPHYLRQVEHAFDPSLGRYRTLQLVTLTIWIAAIHAERAGRRAIRQGAGA